MDINGKKKVMQASRSIRNLINKKYIKLPIYLCASIIIGTLLMIIVYMIPTELMYDNLRDSIELFNIEGMHRHLVSGYYFTDLDNSTDSIMMNIATYTSEESPIDLAMSNPRLTYSDMDNVQTLRQIVEGGEGAQITYYARYWHGYLVLLKPLLLFFSYQEIRIINMITQFLLLLFVLNLLSEKVGKRYMYAFGTAVLALNPSALALSLQYSDIYYIALITMAIMIIKDEWMKKERVRYLYLFLFSGIATAFFDFLTYPIVTLGFLLVTYFLLREGTLKTHIFEMGEFSCCWIFGYLGMWVGKWIVACIFTTHNVFLDAINTMRFRMNGDVGGEVASWSEAIRINLDVIINKPMFYVCVVWFVVFIARILLKKYYIQFDYRILIPLCFICFLPFFWYSIVKNHSIIHYPYSYRNLAVSVYSGLCIISKCVKVNKYE